MESKNTAIIDIIENIPPTHYSDTLTISDISQAIINSPMSMVIMCDSNNRFLGVITEGAIIATVANPNTTTSINDLINKKHPTETPQSTIFLALDNLYKHDVPFLPILSHDSTYLGVVHRTSLLACINGNEKNVLRGLRRERMKSEQIAMIVHDLRNPLTIIWTLAQLVRKNIKANKHDTVEANLQKIESNCEMSQLLIDSLLRVETQEAALAHLSHVNCLLAPLIREISERLQLQCKSKNIALNLSICKEAVQITLDPVLFERAIINIVGNSLKASPEGSQISLSIRFKAESKDSQSGCILIDIIDQGPGFPDGVEEQLVDIFFENNTKNGQKGYGLGLHIANEVIRQHNGKLTLSSNNNKGARVSISLPRATITPDKGDKNDQEQKVNNAHKTVLIVDDDTETLFYIKEILDDYGLNTIVAENGEKAYKFYLEKQPNLILTDLKMPLMDGVELTQKIKQHNSKIPVITYSGFLSQRERFKKHGQKPDVMLTKPLESQDLISAIAMWIR